MSPLNPLTLDLVVMLSPACCTELNFGLDKSSFSIEELMIGAEGGLGFEV
jgi:hypothetical protein